MLFKLYLKLGFILLIFLLTACSNENAETMSTSSNKPVVTIDGHAISIAEFSKEVLKSPYVANMEGLSYDERVSFANNLIKKEILIKEAIKQKLDQEDSFRLAIESYWEQTLITILLKKKMKALEKEIILTDEEIEIYLSKLKKDGNDQTGKISRTDIINSLVNKKKSEAISDWITALISKSKIEINQDNLREFK